jgi:hypothetical protein
MIRHGGHFLSVLPVKPQFLAGLAGCRLMPALWRERLCAAQAGRFRSAGRDSTGRVQVRAAGGGRRAITIGAYDLIRGHAQIGTRVMTREWERALSHWRI